MLSWSVEDVLLIHRRHGLPVNPLYQRGHNRVGCYPCIFATKEEIALIAKHSPETITEISDLELEMQDLRRARNEETPGRYAWPDAATFFQTRNGRRKMLCRVEHEPRGSGAHSFHFEPFDDDCEPVRGLVDHEPMNIHQIVAWARTDDGGKQYSLFEAPPRGGCMKWGLCETVE